MPSAIPSPIKALLDGLNAEPLPLGLSERIQTYVAPFSASDDGPSGNDGTSGNDDFQALLTTLCQKLVRTATDSDSFKPLLATLLNNLRHLRLTSVRVCIDR